MKPPHQPPSIDGVSRSRQALGRAQPRNPLGLTALLAGSAALWLAWPWLRPALWPARGPAWLVVLDGYHRLDRALAVQRRLPLPILLISCPATGQPTPQQWRQARAPLLLLRRGSDTAGQIAALALWRPQLPGASGEAWRSLDAPAAIWLVSDPVHLPRARLAAQIALGSAGTRVLPLPAPPPGSPSPAIAGGAPLTSDWPLWRDALRMQVWRLSGSTAAFLQPALQQHKHSLCYGAAPGRLGSARP